MERYSQFRDKGTAIAPFLPVPTPPASFVWAPVHLTLFLFRLPVILFFSVFYFLILEWLPVGTVVRKSVLWVMLMIPGMWWIDLQVDGVKRGGLAKAQSHLPHSGTIIASSFTSPLDPLYLAGIFCPVFTRSYPGSKKLEAISLFRAILLALQSPTVTPANPAKLVTLQELQEKYPQSIICVFPECTTTNGRGILPFSPSLLTADSKTKIFPVNLRYTPGDITTPVPGSYLGWVWKLLSKPTRCMRVRVARCVYNNPGLDSPATKATLPGYDSKPTGYDTNIFDSPHMRNGIKHGDADKGLEVVTKDEQNVLDRVGEDLARLGRVKRVGLGVADKVEFVRLWQKQRK